MKNLLLFLLLPILTFAQTTYQSNIPGSPRFILPIADSGCLALSECVSIPSIGNCGLTVFRLDRLGDLIWAKSFYPVTKTNGAIKLHDGYLIHGYYANYDTITFCLIKLNEAGDTMWTRNYYRGDRIWIANMKEINDSTIQILGSNIPNLANGIDHAYTFSLRINEMGNVKTFRIYNPLPGTYHQGGSREISTNNVLIGYRSFPLDNPGSFTITKIADSDSVLWSRKFTSNDYSVSGGNMYIDSHGDIVISTVAYNDTIIGGSTRFRYAIGLLKLNSLGDTIYYKLFRNDYTLQNLTSVAEDTGVGYIFAATTNHLPNLNTYGSVIIKTDYDGNILTTNKGINAEWPSCVKSAYERTFFVLGAINLGSTSYLSKIDYGLNLTCRPELVDPDIAILRPGLTVDTFTFTIADSVIQQIPSDIQVFDSIATITTSCLSVPLITSSNNDLQETRHSNYPNPFSTQLTISLSSNEQTTITLYDILSRQVLQQTFTNSTTLNTAQMQSGIYFYELRNDKGVVKKGKVVKQ